MPVAPTIEEELVAVLEGKHLRDPFPIWNRARETAPVRCRAEG